jgi:hypothetical protein
LAIEPHEDAERVSDLVRRVLDALDPSPAYVRGRRWDILAWNRNADALSDFSNAIGPARNMVWRLFRDPSTQCRLGDPACAMRRVVAQFRAVAAKYPHDPAFLELIEDLRLNSAEFRTLWAEHDVLGSTDGLKRYLHPLVGELILDYTVLELPGDSDMRMIVLTAAPGSESERKLRDLRDATSTSAKPALV